MSFNHQHWIIGLVCLTLNFSVGAQGDAKIGKLKTMSCMGCHGPTGNSFVPNFPSLAGQPAGYIAKQIRDFKGAGRYNAMMTGIALGIAELSTLPHFTNHKSKCRQ